MRVRTLIQHFSRWSSPRVFAAGVLSVAVLICWQRPVGFVRQDSAPKAASIDDNEMDARLQQAAAAALGEREGTIIVMDAQTGRLRAVVNSTLAFEQAFAPGSTIKPFTALTAMQAGTINERSRLLCRDRYVNSDFEITCSHPKIAAPFDPAQAIAYSCNYYFGKLGEQLDEDSFNQTLTAFGFGARTNADHDSEATGTLPRGQRWRVSYALGEGQDLLVTPAQLLTAYAALVNGGHLYVPQLAAAQDFKQRERASLNIAPTHRALLIEGMRGAVAYGTAVRAALGQLPLYIFGKTGTATASDRLHTQGWFVGFAAVQSQSQSVPPESTELAVLVFLKNTHGAQCAEMARPVFEAFAGQPDPNQTDTNQTAARKHEETPALVSSTPTASPAAQVRVHLAREGKTVSVSLEDYVLGVLATEGAVEDQPEALKALAVIIRTYTLQHLQRHAQEGYDFCNTTHCQRYTLIEGGEQANVREQIRQALAETAGEVLLDDKGQIADAYFHAACGGRTANVEKLWGSRAPMYLRGVNDEYCTTGSHRDWTDVIPSARLAEALRSDARTDVGARLERVIVSRRDASARAELITLEGERRRIVRGWDFKMIVGRALGWNVLKSSRFEVMRAGSDFIFRGSGFGHGVGLCQEGAHVMAHRGINYRRILSHYFPDTSTGQRIRDPEDKKIARRNDVIYRNTVGAGLVPAHDFGNSGQGQALPLQMFSSTSVDAWKADVLLRAFETRRSTHALLTFNLSTPPSSAHASQNRQLSLASEHFRLAYPSGVEKNEAEHVLRSLEAARSDLLRRVSAASNGFGGPQTLDVIIHATTGDFVAATGQPSWTAGVTKGNRIELQPLAVLRRRGVLATTLRHEYAHAVIDALGQGRTPRWLSEGLAIYFAGEGRLLARFEIKTALSVDELEQRLARPSSADDMRALYATAYRQTQALIRASGEKGVWLRIARKE